METKSTDTKMELRVKKELSPISEGKLYDRYNEMLDEVYGDIEIAGYKWGTAYALREIDPTAYRCGFNNWLDSEIFDGSISEEIGGEYYDGDEVECIREEIESEEAE